MSHAPTNYDCPFCKIASGDFDSSFTTEQSDIVLQNELLTAFVASHQWPNNKGHILIIPNDHYENLYSLPSKYAMPIQEATQVIAQALTSAFKCPGISTRQHNEPAGGQDVWHYHLHVFPRYESDHLYGSERKRVSSTERSEQAERTREALSEILPVSR